MKQFKLFVEGKDDIRFLTDLLNHSLSFSISKSKGSNYFMNCNGWTNIDSSKVVGEFVVCESKEILPLVIFDSDSEDKSTSGGCELRKSEIINRLGRKGISIESEQVFLFPNDSEDGDLESLLERIINPEHEDVMECWSRLEQCLSFKKKGYTIPAQKAKIHTYCIVLLPDSSDDQRLAAGSRRDYCNSKMWNLKSPALNPLNRFLQKHLNE